MNWSRLRDVRDVLGTVYFGVGGTFGISHRDMGDRRKGWDTLMVVSKKRGFSAQIMISIILSCCITIVVDGGESWCNILMSIDLRCWQPRPVTVPARDGSETGRTYLFLNALVCPAILQHVPQV